MGYLPISSIKADLPCLTRHSPFLFAKSRHEVNTQRNHIASTSKKKKSHKVHPGPQAEKKGKGEENSKVVTVITEKMKN